jgi:hypothetical protein
MRAVRYKRRIPSLKKYFIYERYTKELPFEPKRNSLE